MSLSDVEILDAIGAQLYDGVGAQEAMEDLLEGYDVDDDDDDDEIGDYDDDEIEDALGARRRRRRKRRRSRKVIKLARKRLLSFRREEAATPIYRWTDTDTDPKTLELNVIRPFKVQDWVAVAWDENGWSDDPSVVMSALTINGKQQNTSAEAFSVQVRAAAEGYKRPRIDLDTVNSNVPLTATISNLRTLGIGEELNFQVIFAGIAARR